MPFHNVRLRLSRYWETEQVSPKVAVFKTEIEDLISSTIVTWGASVVVSIDTSEGRIELCGEDTLNSPIATEHFRLWKRLRRALAI